MRLGQGALTINQTSYRGCETLCETLVKFLPRFSFPTEIRVPDLLPEGRSSSLWDEVISPTCLGGKDGQQPPEPGE